MTATPHQRAAAAVAVSPTGRLHTYRKGQLRSVCGINLLRSRYGKAYLRRSPVKGWQPMRGNWWDYVDLDDGRTCSLCEQGMIAGTGPGA